MPFRKEVAGDCVVGVRSTDSATAYARSLLSEDERMRMGAGQVMERGLFEALRMERGEVGGDDAEEESSSSPVLLKE